MMQWAQRERMTTTRAKGRRTGMTLDLQGSIAWCSYEVPTSIVCSSPTQPSVASRS